LVNLNLDKLLNRKVKNKKTSFFKFWYEKFLMRFSFAFAFLAFIGVFVYAYITEITIQLPGQEAPFNEVVIENNQTPLMSEYYFGQQKQPPLAEPHLTQSEVEHWLNIVISESLTFDKQSFSAVSKNIRSYFTDAGLRQYGDYLKSSKLINTIRNNDYRMGRRASAGSDVMNRKLFINVQIRRLERENDPSAIAIESWQVKSRR